MKPTNRYTPPGSYTPRLARGFFPVAAGTHAEAQKYVNMAISAYGGATGVPGSTVLRVLVRPTAVSIDVITVQIDAFRAGASDLQLATQCLKFITGLSESV